jgi:hypothetical protein
MAAIRRLVQELLFLVLGPAHLYEWKVNREMISRVKQLLIFSLATLCAPAFGANPARPGTVNYIEGSALLAGKSVTQQSVGSLALDPGQVLSTQHGNAEILLTPGIYLRLDDDSSVRMISPDLDLDSARAPERPRHRRGR